jgi:hypothetical protein
MQHVHAIINQLSSLPPEVWQAALVGLLASTKLVVIKRFIDLHKTEVKALLAVTYIAGSLVIYTINQDPLLQNWVAALLAQTGIAAVASSSFYVIFVKGLWGVLLAPNFGDARKLSAELMSAAVPPEGLPLEAQGKVAAATYQDPVSESDFGA